MVSSDDEPWPEYTQQALRSEALYPGRRLLLVLVEAALDAAGGVDPNRGRTLIVAGFLAEPNDWLNFDAEWRQALVMQPAISHFHMTDFMAGKKQFRNWTPAEKERRFALLLSIIKKYARLAVSLNMPLADHATLLSERAKSLTTEYENAARFLLHNIGEALARDFPDARVSYVMESGTRGEGGLKEVYDLFTQSTKDRNRHRLAGFRSENKRAFTPLQAADILAWEIANWPIGMSVLDPSVRATLREIGEAMPCRWLVPAPGSYDIATRAIEDVGDWRRAQRRKKS